MNNEEKINEPETPGADVSVSAEEKESMATEPVSGKDVSASAKKEKVADIKQEEEVLAQLKKLHEERDQFYGLAKQAQADGINYRNWAEKEMKRLRRQAGENSIVAMLPVLDNLERALNVDEKNGFQPLLDGIRLVKDQFLGVLTGLGVKVLDPLGQQFSPVEADAIVVVPVDDKTKDNVVLGVYQRGYELGEKVIRPAKVQVGRYTEPGPEKNN